MQIATFLAKGISGENRLRILGLSRPLISHQLKELKRSLRVKIERGAPFISWFCMKRLVPGLLLELVGESKGDKVSQANRLRVITD